MTTLEMLAYASHFLPVGAVFEANTVEVHVRSVDPACAGVGWGGGPNEAIRMSRWKLGSMVS